MKSALETAQCPSNTEGMGSQLTEKSSINRVTTMKIVPRNSDLEFKKTNLQLCQQNALWQEAAQ